MKTNSLDRPIDKLLPLTETQAVGKTIDRIDETTDRMAIIFTDSTFLYLRAVGGYDGCAPDVELAETIDLWDLKSLSLITDAEYDVLSTERQRVLDLDNREHKLRQIRTLAKELNINLDGVSDD